MSEIGAVYDDEGKRVARYIWPSKKTREPESASGMPRPPAEAAAPGSTADSGSTGVPGAHDSAQESEGLEYECPRCCRWAKWTDGESIEAGDESDEFWCQTCGEETPLVNCSSRSLPVPSEEDTDEH